MEFRDDAEAQLDEWRQMFFADEIHELCDQLRQPDVLHALDRAGSAPAKTLDIGNLLEIADLFCVLGLRRDEVGTRALEIARACYREIAKWPQPWPANATRSSVSQQLLARTAPVRPKPAVMHQELAALEAAMATPLDERPWALAELHWAKLQMEWRFSVHHGCNPSVDSLAALALRPGVKIPEFGAVLARTVQALDEEFAGDHFTLTDREQVVRELLGLVPQRTKPFVAYLRDERSRADKTRERAIDQVLEFVPGW